MITGGYLFFKEHFHVLQECLLGGVKKIIKNLINANSTVVDVGCGTGELVFCLSYQPAKVVGFDLNEGVLEYSRIKKRRLQVKNAEFITKDVKDPGFLAGNYFDYAVLSMVLHQFNLAEANQILNSTKRVVKHLIIPDFINPLPENIFGWGATIIERMAGGNHYCNFKKYQKQGGLNYFWIITN
jgi:SAM-dependent methyltransferase